MAEKKDKIQILGMKIVKDDNGNVDYVIHHIKKTMDNGDVVTYYKASKFFRLTRVSKASRDNKALMEIQADIIRGLYSAGVNYLQVVANVLKPKPIGLIYLYGVTEIGPTENEARKKCRMNFRALQASFQGTHRKAHIVAPTLEEMNMVIKKISEEKYIDCVKGIPAPRISSGNKPKNDLVQIDTQSQEQMEQFLTGMVAEEFCMMIICSPISQKSLVAWLNKSLKEANKWESQKTGSKSFNMGISIPMSIGSSSGVSKSNSNGTSESSGTSKNTSFGTSETASKGSSETITEANGTSNTSSHTKSTTDGTTQGSSHGVTDTDTVGSSKTYSINGGLKLGEALNVSGGASFGSTQTHAHGTADTTTNSTTHSNGTSEGITSGSTHTESKALGNTESTTKGTSQTESVGSNSSKGVSNNSSYGTNYGSSASMGLSPNISWGTTYQFTNKDVEYICSLLAIQNQRLADSTEGEGAFFVDFYISTETEDNQKEVQSLVASTWINNDSKIDVLRAEIFPREEQDKLSYHMMGFSPCLDMEINRRGKYYKYSSILKSSEIAAYSHPPRISVGGLDSRVEDRPCMRVPNDRQDKEIFIGNIINGERFNKKQYEKYGNGYMTDFKISIGSNELHHTVISGASGSGKSVAATRMVAGLYNNTEIVDPVTKKKSKRRILILDPNGEWRLMANVVQDPSKFRFFSVGNPLYRPLKMNLLRIPKYISATDYYSMVTEHFCSAYGLLDRAEAQIKSVIYDLYEREGVFDKLDDPFWAYERSKNITLEDVYDKVAEEKTRAEKAGERYNVDALTTYLTRLQMYKKNKAKEYLMFCNKGGMSVDEVLGNDSVTVIESNGLASGAQSFFFTLLMDGIFRYAQATGGFYGKPDQYETFIILEEANTVLCPSDSGGGSNNNGKSEGSAALKRFSDLLNQGRKYGLFVWTITQTIGMMPESVIANSGIILAGKTEREQDINILVKMLGFDGKFEDRDVAKWFPRMPIGEFVVKFNKGFKEVDQEPMMVKIAQLNIEKPTNEELDLKIQEGEMRKKMDQI